MKKELQTIRWTFVFLILLFLPLTYYGLYTPMRNTLESEALERFRHVADGKFSTLQGFVDRSVENARSLSSRTAIREMTYDYLMGKVSWEELKTFTTPRYLDGVHAIDELLGAERRVGERVLVADGEKMSLSSEPFREEVFLFVDLKSEELVITSPLVEKGLLMGQDRIRVDLVPLFDSLSRDGYEVRLHDTSDELEIHDSQAVQTRVLQGTDYGVSVIVEKKALFQTLDESVESTLLVFFVALAGVGLLFHLTTLVFSGRLIEALEKQVDERTKHLRARTLELEEVNAHLEEEIEARQRAESEGEAKKAMIAELGHDIRTPLGGMSGLLQLLERESLTGDQEELVSMLRRSVLSLDDLLGNVLERAKLESGQVSPSTRAFSPLELTEEVVFLLDPLAKEKNLDLKKVQVKGPVPRQVVGDPHRLRQILTNLLSNAIKYTKEGSVTLSIERLESKDERSWLSFSIEDTGPGMESNQIPKLFDPFIRGLGEDQKSQGTGLGLSLVKGMVELMDGEIEVSSLQGEGTTFNVRLPFQELK